MAGRNPFDDSDDDGNEFEQQHRFTGQRPQPVPQAPHYQKSQSTGSLRAASARTTTGNRKQQSRKASMKNGMGTYISSSKIKFQEILDRANTQLISEGDGSATIDYSDDNDDTISKFLWNERGSYRSEVFR